MNDTHHTRGRHVFILLFLFPPPSLSRYFSSALAIYASGLDRPRARTFGPVPRLALRSPRPQAGRARPSAIAPHLTTYAGPQTRKPVNGTKAEFIHLLLLEQALAHLKTELESVYTPS
ncbi:hypothetical protein FRC12_002731 [Ceratobasidium sp. 428]|nr:hypothetical protein FRC12_002731 [Ceratobasidium sp. 428]